MEFNTVISGREVKDTEVPAVQIDIPNGLKEATVEALGLGGVVVHYARVETQPYLIIALLQSQKIGDHGVFYIIRIGYHADLVICFKD